MAAAGNHNQDLRDEFRILREMVERMNGGEECLASVEKLEALCEELGVSPSEILEAVKILAANLPDIVNSTNPQRCIVAILKCVQPFVALAGPEGLVVAHVLGMLAHMIGQTTDSPSLTEALKAALDQCRIETLEDRAQGVIQQFSQNNIYMSATNDGQHHPNMDLATLGSLLAIKDHGVEFLGELYSFVIRKSKKAKSEAEAHEVLKLVQLFCQLTIARMLVLQQLFELIQRHNGAAAQCIRSVRDALYKTSKTQLDFLSTPALDQVSTAAVYNGSEWPVINGYLKIVGARVKNRLDIPSYECVIKCGGIYLERSLIKLIPPRYRLQSEHIWFTSPETYTIEKAEESFYVIKSCQISKYFSKPTDPIHEFPYVFRQSIDDASHLNIVKTQEGKILISDRSKPCGFLYSNWACNLRFWEGDPGPGGHWEIERV